MVHIFLCGSGGGGGGGMTGASLTARGGGGGGGSSSFYRTSIPAFLLPDILYIQVGLGGLGGAATFAGGAGVNSFVTVAPDSAAANIVAVANNVLNGGGGAGTAAVGGAAGIISTNAGITQGSLMALGNFIISFGRAGNAGGAQTGANGGGVTALFNGISSGGAGGGGTNTADTNFSGGGVTGAGIIPSVPAGTSAAGAGNPGIYLKKPFCMTGGTGGGTAGASGTAGRGGNGAPGSGGGGGGGGVTGGAGGNGGNGLVIITVT